MGESSAVPQLGVDAQSVINNQLVDQADIVIANHALVMILAHAASAVRYRRRDDSSKRGGQARPLVLLHRRHARRR